MSSPASHNLVERIHACGRQLVLAVTGGGSGAIAALLQVPGASGSVLEAVVPYSPAALERYLGGPVEQACSDWTARALAMAAFERARLLADADPSQLCGIGATASLATVRPKRGAHRVHVAWQTADTTAVGSRELTKGRRTRAEEEQLATRLILEAIAEACRLDVSPRFDRQRREQAPVEWSELLLGKRRCLVIDGEEPTGDNAPAVLFPGSFNPLHAGHERMAEQAAQRLGQPVTFELSIANVEKPPLDFIEVAARLAGLSGRRVLLTRAATFAEKCRLAPGCVFVVGADTLLRIAEPKYYGGDTERRDAAIRTIADSGARFLVFGRTVEGRFTTLAMLSLPDPLSQLCEEVPEREFHEDIRSTDVRSRADHDDTEWPPTDE